MLSVRAMVNSKQDACVVKARGLVWSGLVEAVEGWSVIFRGTRPLSGQVRWSPQWAIGSAPLVA